MSEPDRHAQCARQLCGAACGLHSTGATVFGIALRAFFNRRARWWQLLRFRGPNHWLGHTDRSGDHLLSVVGRKGARTLLYQEKT